MFRSDEWERTIVFNAIGEPWICLVSGKPFSEPFLKFYIRELQSVSFKGHLKLHMNIEKEIEIRFLSLLETHLMQQ